MVFNACTGQIILFGGQNGGSVGLNDTWGYDADANTWTNLLPANSPPPLLNPTMAFNPTTGQIILFGGGEGTGSSFSNNTWAYDADANTWTNLSSTNPPPGRLGSSMTFDPCIGQNILFGGFNGNYLNDTWAYISSINAWTNLAPSNPPSARYDLSTVFNPCIGQNILFGGANNGVSLNDTWAYNSKLNNWTPLTLSNPPSAREYAAITFDPSIGQVVLFSGFNGSNYLNDTETLQIGTAPLITSVNAATFRVGTLEFFRNL